jgi:aliphatic nitrilase
MTTTKVAAAHLEPALLDKAATIEKVLDAVAEAARQGAELIAFPESFVPGFPVWTALRAPIFNHELFAAFVQNSLYVDGPEIAAVCKAAQHHGIIVSMGFSERNPASVGSIWNSNLLIGSDGRILNHHRKIVPTFYEKLLWTPGDGHGLRVVSTSIGRMGMLICGENTNPLARYTLIAEAEEIHISTYPPLWPTRDPASNGKNYDLENAIRIRAGAHSFEAKAFNLVVSSVFGPTSARVLETLGPEAEKIIDSTPVGVSMIVDPYGDVIGDIIRDEGIHTWDIDPSAVLEPKQFHDVSGAYNRFDIFDLRVHRQRVEPIRFTGESNSPLGATGQYPTKPVFAEHTDSLDKATFPQP